MQNFVKIWLLLFVYFFTNWNDILSEFNWGISPCRLDCPKRQLLWNITNNAHLPQQENDSYQLSAIWMFFFTNPFIAPQVRFIDVVVLLFCLHWNILNTFKNATFLHCYFHMKKIFDFIHFWNMISCNQEKGFNAKSFTTTVAVADLIWKCNVQKTHFGICCQYEFKNFQFLALLGKA